MKTHLRLSMVALVLAVAGCTTTYVPAPGIPNVKQVPNFPAGTRVSLVNAQTATNIVLLTKHPNGSTYNANMHDWTERLVRSLSETLKKKKVVVDPSAPKAIKVSIEKANVHTKAGGWAFQCDLNWNVELSSGQVIPMYVEEGHWKVEDCSNVAVRRACLLTLSNETVRAFLSTP
jgi:hypothetical protein